MSAEQEYMNGMTPGPLTREIPECMRDKYTVVQAVFDVLAFLMVAIGYIIQAIYRSIVGHPKKDLKGSIALVTGGGGGLGSLIALRLARLGCVVVLWDINKQGLEDTVKLVKGVGGKCFGYVVDLTKRDDIYRVGKQVDQEVGRYLIQLIASHYPSTTEPLRMKPTWWNFMIVPTYTNTLAESVLSLQAIENMHASFLMMFSFTVKVSLLINNAGVVSGHYLLDTPDHLIQRTFDVNILSHFWTVKAFLPAMIEHNDGHIVTIASMAGHVGVAKLVDYCSSKSAACGFDESLRLELEVKGVKGVHTSLICPYFIRATGMFEEVNARFVPTLSSNEVAERVVYAIRTNEALAVMPAYFRLLLPFKWLVPWPCISELIRGLVPDAAPESMRITHRRNKPEAIPNLAKSDSRPMTVVPPARHEREV